MINPLLVAKHTLVVPAKAATYTPCPLDVARPVISSNRGSYGSPLSRGRQGEIRRADNFCSFTLAENEVPTATNPLGVV